MNGYDSFNTVNLNGVSRCCITCTGYGVAKCYIICTGCGVAKCYITWTGLQTEGELYQFRRKCYVPDLC